MKLAWRSALCIAAAAAIAPAVPAQEHGGGGGVGCGDVFGDLIEVLRDDVTGQPILAKRWVELPAEVPGYGWGYCKIAVDAAGNELAFAPLSCDVAPEDLTRVVSVDYFGRLNGGRTKEKNSRMHFNEVVSTIKAAEMVHQEPGGRLMTGYDCKYSKQTGYPLSCNEWVVFDSPMESLALYVRLMKYGHLQTDPMELDAWKAGDPKAPTAYHPALGPDDYKKFHPSVRHLLPGFRPGNPASFDPWACFIDTNADGLYDPPEPYFDANGNGAYDAGETFTDANGNGVWNEADGFNPVCATAEHLDARDLTRGGSFLGGAANKTGKITPDLVQYINRLVKIPNATEFTVATLDTVPALVRVCDVTGDLDPNAEEQVEPAYGPCYDPVPANSAMENYALFTDVRERFVDFSAASYARQDWRDETVPVVKPHTTPGMWVEDTAGLMAWLEFVNGPQASASRNLDAFVEGASDALRSIEFIHNYAIPEDLGWDFAE